MPTKTTTERVRFSDIYRTRAEFSYHRFGGPGGSSNPPPVLSVYGTINTGGTRVTEDSPNYKYRIRNNMNATGLLQASYVNAKVVPGSINKQVSVVNDPTYGLVNYYYQINGDVQVVQPLYFPGDQGAVVARVQNKALESFIAQALQKQRTLQSLVVAGEARQTTRMVRDAGKQLFRSAFNLLRYGVSVKKRFLSKLARSTSHQEAHERWRKHASRVFPDLWLTYAYGVQPLVSDVYSACEALATDRSLLPDAVEVSGFASETFGPSYPPSATTWGGMPILVQAFEQHVVDCRYYGKVQAEDSGAFGFDTRNLGVSWSEVIPTVYELIPYSFLVDYFSNLGKIIEAASFNKATVAWVARTSRTVSTRRLVSTRYTGSTAYPNSESVQFKAWSADVEVKTINRQALDNVGTPTLYLKLPGLDSSKWLNMAALATMQSRLVRS